MTTNAALRADAEQLDLVEPATGQVARRHSSPELTEEFR